MKREVNECVGCPHDMGCLGDACSYVHIERYYCDECEDEGVEFSIDGRDLCQRCAEIYLQELFDDLTLDEKAELLNVSIYHY